MKMKGTENKTLKTNVNGSFQYLKLYRECKKMTYNVVTHCNFKIHQ